MCLIYRKDAEPFAAVGRGFTLVELLLVIVIIGILSGMLMVSSGTSVDLSQKNVCAGNRRVIKSSYMVKAADGRNSFAEIIAEVMADYPKAKAAEVSEKGARYRDICPSGGDYVVSVDAESGNISCACTFEGHGSETAEDAVLAGFPLLVDFGNKLGDILKSSMSDKDKIAAIKELLGAYGANYLNNDTIRKALLDKMGGSWPAVEKDSALYNALKAVYDVGDKQYIQPYFVNGTKEPVYWVSSSASGNGAWTAYAIYYNGKWYQPPKDKTDYHKANKVQISGAFNSAATVADALKKIGLINQDGTVSSSWTQIQ